MGRPRWLSVLVVGGAILAIALSAAIMLAPGYVAYEGGSGGVRCPVEAPAEVAAACDRHDSARLPVAGVVMSITVGIAFIPVLLRRFLARNPSLRAPLGVLVVFAYLHLAFVVAGYLALETMI